MNKRQWKQGFPSGKVFLSWKFRLMGTILIVAAILLSVSFWGSYEIYIQKLEETNFKATTLAFEQTERNIDRKLWSAENSANQLLDQDEVIEYLTRKQRTLPEHTLVERKLQDRLSAALNANRDLSGIALLDGRGKVMAATAWGMTATTIFPQDSRVYRFLESTESIYPFYTWCGAGESRKRFADVDFDNFFERRDGEQIRMLTAFRMITYGSEKERPAYLMVAVDDLALRECYSQVLYNQNTAVLLDSGRRIISSTDGRTLNEYAPYADRLPGDGKVGSFSFWQGEEEHQIIYYPLSQYDWVLVNEIPKSAYGQQAEELKELLLFLWVFTLFLMLVFFGIWVGKYTRPVERIIYSMKRVQEGDLSPVRFPASGIREMDELGEQFGITVSTIEALINRVRRMDSEKAEEELRTLQYQINPHFLYNSLSSIRWMAEMNNNPRVADALLLLARMIEPILRSPSWFWTVREELNFIDSYAGMLTLRFGGALNFETVKDPGLEDHIFPRFTLQPILENCFTHGAIPGDTLHIKVSLTRTGGKLRATVTNTGKRIDPETLADVNQSLKQHKEPDAAAGSIGLRNVNKRLFLLYGREGGLHILTDENGNTTVILEIPDEEASEMTSEKSAAVSEMTAE